MRPKELGTVNTGNRQEDGGGVADTGHSWISPRPWVPVEGVRKAFTGRKRHQH